MSTKILCHDDMWLLISFQYSTKKIFFNLMLVFNSLMKVFED